MIRTAGSIGAAIEREDDHTYSSALGSKHIVVCFDDSISILDQVLGIESCCLSQTRIDINCDLPTWTGTDEFRVPAIAGPSGRLWASTAHSPRLESDGSCSNPVTHFRVLS